MNNKSLEIRSSDVTQGLLLSAPEHICVLLRLSGSIQLNLNSA